ncbi:hypothetical protein HU200_059700 [Digitaria exilis]|uniref:Uncharacterized protein n=1 Tax=Digitaria exilis TaxID=1010633 RepID=A0A835A7P1_9POAL|nr:hypothetical protein HU200_059700 [Digitaria exilis]
MADCFPPEADDLHRRWLPREIFADIGIVDTDAVVPDATPDAAVVVGVEELAAQLAGILGGGSKACQLAPPRKPTPPPAVAAPRHGAQVCGLERSVVAACGGTNAAGAAGAVAWPFVPYPPMQWQGGSNLVNLGGVLDYCYSSSAFPLATYCAVPLPQPANIRGGTGVFIPRTACNSPPAKGGIATRAWSGRPATGRKQEWQQSDGMKPALGEKAPHACPRPELALLPQDWSYR